MKIRDHTIHHEFARGARVKNALYRINRKTLRGMCWIKPRYFECGHRSLMHDPHLLPKGRATRKGLPLVARWIGLAEASTRRIPEMFGWGKRYTVNGYTA